MDSYFFPRDQLLKALKDLISKGSFVFVSSPSATGKTSTLCFMGKCLMDTNIVYVPLYSDISAFQSLREVGLDLENKTWDESFNSRTIVILDDAQQTYGDKHFWKKLIKDSVIQVPKLLANVKFIIASTYLLGGADSPTEFHSLPRLNMSDFLLNTEDSLKLLTDTSIGLSPAALRDYDILKNVIASSCGGNIGALRISIDYLAEICQHSTTKTEEFAIDCYFNVELLNKMARCFGTQLGNVWPDPVQRILMKLLGDESVSEEISFEQPPEIVHLLKCGVLRELRDRGLCFSSPLAQRYFSKVFYPHRLPYECDDPASIYDLTVAAIRSMSAASLRQSTSETNDFPKEAIFRHLFMTGLTRNTKLTTQVLPELSKVFPNVAGDAFGKIKGEIDFFIIDGNLRWGIALLVNGNDSLEHRRRFCEGGKYAPLKCNAFVVVDFRASSDGSPTKCLARKKHLMTVFFTRGTFERATIVIGEEKQITVDLQT
eukprot:CAMPEP_0201112216 /NCGR_PEP_ID=MMETSP0812-20130820/77108_1 /ASSEMBLY_ACC=CAM_ASM_000668 /TAXON_ID=98059 /ORGANISM="Dinobryon sp., Strain UTEXLB2267" /LENGTH=486 /DNA_ID=CAMNT_0047375501 /DNA_START=1043 /DNA_END=2503 /DNA_ORIENTATION=+